MKKFVKLGCSIVISVVLSLSIYVNVLAAATPAVGMSVDNAGGGTPPVFILIIVAALGLIGAGVALIVISKKDKPQEVIVKPPAEQTQLLDANATMLLLEDAHINSGGGSGFFIILNDIAQPSKRFEAIVENTVEIGREPSQPGITIDYDRKISRRHFSVSQRDGVLWIEDLGSSNKTYVNDEIVRTPRILHDGDVLSCGNTKLSVWIERCRQKG